MVPHGKALELELEAVWWIPEDTSEASTTSSVCNISGLWDSVTRTGFVEISADSSTSTPLEFDSAIGSAATLWVSGAPFESTSHSPLDFW